VNKAKPVDFIHEIPMFATDGKILNNAENTDHRRESVKKG